MRRLVRPRLVLPTLGASGSGGKKAEEHRRAHVANPADKIEFPDHWNKPDVRGALYAMHGWVCAYCQCALPRNDDGAVEHFRPKSGDAKGPQLYWWLAYDFGNYLLSCRDCNSARKSTKFPLALGAARVAFANRNDLVSEARLLAHPVDDPVEGWMRVEWRDPAREGEVVATMKVADGLGDDALAHDRAVETIRFFQLNTDPALYRERRQQLEKATMLYRKDDGVALRRMASRYQPFGIMVRHFLEDVAPELLPKPAEELCWLLEEIGDRLNTALETMRAYPEVGRLAEAMIKELCWALAVLWKDPPTGDAGRAVVEQWLKAKGFKGLVEDFYAKLTEPSPPAL